jgi:hypothetical protein
VNYGDGSATMPLTLNGKTFTLSHTYAAILTTYTITVIVTDNDGVSGSGSTTVTVIL